MNANQLLNMGFQYLFEDAKKSRQQIAHQEKLAHHLTVHFNDALEAREKEEAFDFSPISDDGH
ncbi:MAG: hypothetical protein JWM56_345 [Candidatus Peribacteria bacterium]|nr:hypothetical protein [Candidatus Peribacteria bacterium]